MNEVNLSKITITSSSDQELGKALERVNQDFEGGRVTKTDLASWLISRGAITLDTTAVEEIRQAHFNQVAYLRALLKKLKAAGRSHLEGDESTALQSVLGAQPIKVKKKSSRLAR